MAPASEKRYDSFKTKVRLQKVKMIQRDERRGHKIVLTKKQKVNDSFYWIG